MIKQSPYLPKQMNGPVINSIMAGLDAELEAADKIEKYLHDLSINTAQEDELESIGCIVGFPRPLVPEGFSGDNVLILTSLPHFQDASIGLSSVGSEIGGRFTSNRSSETDYMDLGLYRSLLDKVAYIKRYGVTLYSIDKIARLVDDAYEIYWNEDKDIVIDFQHNIGFKNVWVLTQLFYRLSTSPQVIIQSA